MNEKLRNWLFNIFCVLGIFFVLVLVHEIVHFIDGYGPNIAICFGFLNTSRTAFVVNGDNYTLFRGEALAYTITVVVAIIIYILLFYNRKGDKNG